MKTAFKKIISLIILIAVIYVIGKIGYSDMVDQQQDAIITQQIINGRQ
nr:MAG TPA: Protein of unknown function (DUF3985) [Caudoviricetes sp.]